MQFLTKISALIAWLAWASLASAQSGGPYDLSWHKIAGGGGASSGDRFTISGTIGQLDAGTQSGGNFQLEGGFWSGVQLVQVPGGPVLRIKFVAGNAIISWPVSVTGFSLENSAAVSGAAWNVTPQPIVDTADEHTVTVPASGVIRVFRLKK